MVRCFVLAAVLLPTVAGLAGAGEFTATLFQVKGGKVTFVLGDKKTKKSKMLQLPVSAKARIVTGVFNKETTRIEPGEEIPGGLDNDLFKNIAPHGIQARLITAQDGTTIAEMRVFQVVPAKKSKKSPKKK